MTPFNSNPMNMDARSAANVVGGMGSTVASATPSASEENPADTAMQKVAGTFRDAWKSLESLNGEYGGDADKFRAMQKAAEDWFTSIAQNLPESSMSNY